MPAKENGMKRFHVHVAVDDLQEGIAFYSKLFHAEPTVRKPDYAKWMVEDPRLNFAISARGAKPGLNHLGFQVDSDGELRAMHDRLAEADAGLVEETDANCCYAKSDKYWVTDPAGIAWETYHTLDSIPVFGTATETARPPAACCGEGASAGTDRAARRGCCS
jgi:catechol 2,3-dioxygenase-like lactoylglutathione lyase family enzyme